MGIMQIKCFLCGRRGECSFDTEFPPLIEKSDVVCDRCRPAIKTSDGQIPDGTKPKFHIIDISTSSNDIFHQAAIKDRRLSRLFCRLVNLHRREMIQEYST